MPYLHCPSCRLATFSVARYSSVDQCPRCGSDLALDPRRLFRAPGDVSAGTDPLAARVISLRRERPDSGSARG